MGRIKKIGAWIADEWDGVRDRWDTLSSQSKAFVGLAGIVVIIIVLVLGLLTGRSALSGGDQIDTQAYSPALVNPHGGDLPAPDFVGWQVQPREEPPQMVQVDDSIAEVSPAKCVPGGQLHQAAQGILLNDVSEWSGETLMLPAYNARADIDITDAKQSSMSAIDEWTKECARTRFVKDGVEHVQRIQTLPLEADQWNMDDSRVYVVTLTRLQDGKNLGSTSTLYAVSRASRATAQAALTIRGSVDDNALSTLNKLWDKQTIKLREFLNGNL